MKKRKKHIKGLDLYVIFSIAMLLIYTVIAVWLAYEKELTLDTLTTCFFAFFGGEIVTCALIKIFKLRETPKDTNYDKEDNVG